MFIVRALQNEKNTLTSEAASDASTSICVSNVLTHAGIRQAESLSHILLCMILAGLTLRAWCSTHGSTSLLHFFFEFCQLSKGCCACCDFPCVALDISWVSSVQLLHTSRGL